FPRGWRRLPPGRLCRGRRTTTPEGQAVRGRAVRARLGQRAGECPAPPRRGGTNRSAVIGNLGPSELLTSLECLSDAPDYLPQNRFGSIVMFAHRIREEADC